MATETSTCCYMLGLMAGIPTATCWVFISFVFGVVVILVLFSILVFGVVFGLTETGLIGNHAGSWAGRKRRLGDTMLGRK
ncbi:hypothetical protein HYG86_00995 [Alkalicella caledoniensis]|uniref:Uncharacterized protein n=1 Tax=Alkalicella caledoniensis TaxID=2731377 RepID=A0A7G9W436_ALKCA|nr:hypothetical protein [Alkalicella caledoniensis]QNO13448.1 hypothetical protein HYG86_00995 [Alkalicella caledoniensis]